MNTNSTNSNNYIQEKHRGIQNYASLQDQNSGIQLTSNSYESVNHLNYNLEQLRLQNQILKDQSNFLSAQNVINGLQSQQNTQRIEQNISQNMINMKQSPNRENVMNQFSRSKSAAIGLDMTFPANQENYDRNSSFFHKPSHIDVSKSMDTNMMSPTALIQSCLTFSGDDLNDDMNFLSQAMQPDKVFDLPMALVKVQNAFQNANQNAMKLKETLELVLQREQQTLEKYQKLKHDHQSIMIQNEQENIQLKQSFKDQLKQFTASVNQLQGQIQEKDQNLQKQREQFNTLFKSNQDLKSIYDIQNDKLAMIENLKENLQNQLRKKHKEFEDLRSQFDELLQQENYTSEEIDRLQKRSSKEEQKLRSIIDEKNVLIDVLQKEIDVSNQEKRLLDDANEKMMLEIKKLKNTMRDEVERKYIEVYEQKRILEKENQELIFQLQSKNDLVNQLEKQYEKAKQEQDKLENQLFQIKKDITKINENNRDAYQKQRESFEKRIHEMEEEVTKASLNRYKIELEQKQKFLKMTKKYDEQLREMRHCLGYVFNKLGLAEIPEFLRDDLIQSINDMRIENPDLQIALSEFNQVIQNLKENKNFNQDTQNLQAQYEQLLKAYKNELNIRRGLHNQLQEIRGNIRVMARIRPLLNHECKGRKKQQCLKQINQYRLVVTNDQQGKEHSFQFDRVFEPTSNQQDVQEEVSQLILSSLDGFNVCIMAYGQTGSGKTYTMIGDDENPGLYFSSVDDLFAKIHDRKKLIDYDIGVSIVEIYNEQLRDLLSKKGHQAGQLIKLRDNGDGETHSDQIIKPVKSKNQILHCLREACMNRTVGVTHYNEQSSRSHFVFTLHLTGKHRQTNEIFRGRLNLIDLAGSERILKSQAEGDRIKEALNINQSLTTLGKVFLALLNKAPHVPYRDSKLTHYLKDSLGGESKTMLIVQVSPNMNDYGESLSSLNFGQRVSHIEKGQIRATIESPDKIIAPSMIGKRSKSQNRMEYDATQNKSATPQNRTFSGASANNTFQYN